QSLDQEARDEARAGRPDRNVRDDPLERVRGPQGEGDDQGRRLLGRGPRPNRSRPERNRATSDSVVRRGLPPRLSPSRVKNSLVGRSSVTSTSLASREVVGIRGGLPGWNSP